MKSAALLAAHGVKPSAQRLAIYENLRRRRDHPTADAVWAALAPLMPTLSRTTVYTTLRLLCGGGLARLIPGGGEDMRFDADLSSHAHFRCDGCGVLIDVRARGAQAAAFSIPRGAKVLSVETRIRGLCPECAR